MYRDPFRKSSKAERGSRISYPELQLEEHSVPRSIVQIRYRGHRRDDFLVHMALLVRYLSHVDSRMINLLVSGMLKDSESCLTNDSLADVPQGIYVCMLVCMYACIHVCMHDVCDLTSLCAFDMSLI